MLTEATLREVIQDLKKTKSLIKPIKRKKEIPTNSKQVVVITGIRRCGKSTLLRQILKSEKKKIFLNFEDTRLEGFESADFKKVEQIADSENITWLAFDEIQNVDGWEKYIRSMHDNGFKILITGSNASMLSKELGTKLTGRNQQIELFPFNYPEYLLFKKEKAGYESFLAFLSNGGFPEYLAYTENEYLRNLLRDIVIRDVAVRRGIKNERVLLRLAMYLITNIGKEISYNSISKTLEIKSVRTTIDYCDYLQESYLMDFIPRFSFSIKQQLITPKKIYAIDTGMARTNSSSYSEDKGRMLENAIFLYLRQFTSDILYFKDDKSECDFLIRKNEKVIHAIQVCWQLTEDNLEREITVLKNAMKIAKVKNGIIITANQDDQFGEIKAIPAWKWMLKNLEF
jgi:predicted AAA+ superfamily ATPase